jgi:secreted trypsin-like serine protease
MLGGAAGLSATMIGEDFAVRRKRVTRLVALVGALAAVLSLTVAFAGQANAIANGEVVPEGKYRFSVKLTMTGIPTADGGRRNSACSGALVARQWVITAGHCFRDVNGVRVERPVADLTTATVGRADLDGTNGQVATVVAVRQSPTNDLSLAKLDVAIRGIRPIALSRTAPGIGDVVRLTGYGSTTSTNPTPSKLLRTGQFIVTAVNDSTIAVTGHAPAPDTTPCPYDSGAPYFIEHRYGPPALVSIENFGPSCPHTNEETTARVDNIRRWILSIVNG